MSNVCIIDGGNLRSFPYALGYEELYTYLTDELGIDKGKVFYLGSVPTSHYFKMYDWVGNDFIDLDSFHTWLSDYESVCGSPVEFKHFIKEHNIRLFPGAASEGVREKELLGVEKIKKQAEFMLLLRSFGYCVEVTPLKHHRSPDTSQVKRKGDSDIRIAVKVFDLLSGIKKIVFVSGDGDFLPLLKKVRGAGKEVVVMGYKSKDMRTNRTAKEIVSFVGGSFLNFASAEMRDKLEYRKAAG